MRAKGFEEWLSRNVGKGGERPSYDPFNKAKKGSERYPEAEEYANKGVQEFHRYSERREENVDDDDRKQNESSQSDSARKSKNSKSTRSPSQLVRNMVARVVTVAVGAVITVTGYQTIQANEAKNTPAPIVAQTSWTWSEDFKTVSAKFLDGNGNLIKEVPATVSELQTEATCNTDGSITYTAVVEEDGKTFSDTKSTVLKATGHDWDDGRLIVLDNGETVMIFECGNCHEEFTVSIGLDEE